MIKAADAMPNGAAGARVCVLVLGMHRSGTSALARTLNLLGCDLPKTLVPEAPGNEAGHWEPAPVGKLNDALLESAGTNWRDFEPVNPDWFRSPRAAEYRAKAIATLREEFGDSFLYVLKDPRICRIAGWWAQTLEAAGAAPAILQIVRHPIEVAESLKKRDNFDVALGALLWLRNTLDAEAQTRGRRRAFISYDALLANWSEAIGRAQESLGVAWPKRQSFVTPSIDQFLSDKHRHHRRANGGGADGAHAWAAEAFTILERWAASGESAGDYAALDALRARLDEAGHAFARLVALQWYHQGQAAKFQQQAADLEKKLTEGEMRARQAAGESAEFRARLAQTESALKQRTVETEETARELASFKSRASDLEATIAGLRESQNAASAELNARFSEIAELSSLLRNRETALADLNQRLADFAAAGAESSRGQAGSASGADGYMSNLAAIEKRLADRERAFADLDALFAARVAEATELKRAISDRDAAESVRAHQRALRDVAVAQMIASAPLPRFRRKREIARRAAALSGGALFDADWYKAHYADVAQAGVDPLRHFVEFGAREGRLPSGDAHAARSAENET